MCCYTEAIILAENRRQSQPIIIIIIMSFLNPIIGLCRTVSQLFRDTPVENFSYADLHFSVLGVSRV